MKDVVVRAGSSLLAAVLAYLALTLLSDGMSLVWKLVVAVVLGGLALWASVWASSKSAEGTPGTTVASNVKAQSATIEGLSVEVNGGPAKVVSDLEVAGHLSIKDAQVKQQPTKP